MKKVWMDSGAFSAKTLGAEISLTRYCQWLTRYAPFIDHYAVLDAIGSDETSAETTWANQRRMEDKGLAPVPCFHYGEPLRFLERYVEEYDYVALGGMVPVETARLKLWLDVLWCNYLTFAGQTIIKVHGFGMTTFELMSRYPWYTVDSSSWLMGGRNGSVLFLVNGAPVALGCSAKQAGTGTLAGLGADQRAVLLAQANRALDEEGEDDAFYSETIRLLEDSYIARNLVTLYTFEKWREKWVMPEVGARPELTLFPEPDEDERTPFDEFKARMGEILPKNHKLDIYYAGCWPGGWKQLPNYPRMFSYHYIDQHGSKKAVNFNMQDEFLAVVKSKGG